MASVVVNGGCKHLNHNQISEYIQWLAIRLLGKRLAKNVSIDVHCEKLLSYEGGYAGNIDDKNISPRQFEIILNKAALCHIQMKVLAHEMVHIKQMARNELRLWTNAGKWLGYIYTFEDDETYRSTPWEAEARMMEETLLNEYLESTGLQLKFLEI